METPDNKTVRLLRANGWALVRWVVAVVLMLLAVWQLWLLAGWLPPLLDSGIKWLVIKSDRHLPAVMEWVGRGTVVVVLTLAALQLVWPSGGLVGRQVEQALRYLFARDLDAQVTFGDKEGYGQFTALATFALAQGVALTQVARGEDRVWLVLGIYAVAVAVTVFWIRSMLAAVRPLTPVVSGRGTDAANRSSVPVVFTAAEVRAYDRPTITYGRWAQGWTLVLAAVLIVLGTQGLLPNQTTREPYRGGNIQLFFQDASTVRMRFYGGGESWFSRFLPAQFEGGQLSWFEQRKPFAAYHTPFRVKLVLSERYEGDELQVFLARRDSTPARLHLKEVRYIGRVQHRTFDVVGADRNDFIVVIGYTKAVSKGTLLGDGAAAELEVMGSVAP